MNLEKWHQDGNGLTEKDSVPAVSVEPASSEGKPQTLKALEGFISCAEMQELQDRINELLHKMVDSYTGYPTGRRDSSN